MEYNKLIAEFMGIKTHHNDKSIMVKETLRGNEVIPIDSLQYDSSWDWLIPVVEKCRKIQIKGSQRLIDNINMRFMVLDLLGTWGNINDFIKWYNDEQA